MSAHSHPEVVSDNLFKEVALGRMAGPFAVRPLPNLVVSLLGVVPKREPNKFRLIHHLSYPLGGSVNYVFDPKVCLVSFTSFNQVLVCVQRFRPGSLLAKCWHSYVYCGAKRAEVRPSAASSVFIWKKQ